MDIKDLKNYIYENNYIEQILESLNCHHIKFHVSGEYWTACNPDGDNKNAIIVYNNENLICLNKTRQMIKTNRTTDLIDLVCFINNLSFPRAMQFLCTQLGLSYYHDFNEDIPESFKILKLLDVMNNNIDDLNDNKPLKPINENILSYYKSYVNDLFYEDNIDYNTQIAFEIKYDTETNRIVIPIRSELGDLVGIKGRCFIDLKNENENQSEKITNKYIYLEPCSKSKILYGIYKTLPYIQRTKIVYVLESEKSVMQCWSMGFRNTVSTGGKTISGQQINMLVRTGAIIVLCFDKDVKKDEIGEIADKFPDGIPIYYMFDEDNILNPKESPSDNPQKWQQLIVNNVYKIK